MEGRYLAKQAVCYYICIASAALALLVGACVLAMIVGMGSLGLGLGLTLVAALSAAVAYANAAPLNKARCQLWLLIAVVVFACYFVLFILCDLARLPVVFDVGARDGISAMAIVCLAFACLCLAAEAFLVVRVVLLATGRYATDAERRAAKEVESAAPHEVQPRAVDNEAIVAKAEQEFNATRMVVEEDAARPLVSPHQAREIAKRRVQVVPSEPIVAPQKVEIPQVEIEQEPTQENKEQEAIVLSDPTPAPIVADAESLLMQDEVEPDQDIRSEIATHHIRQPIQERGNDLYNDFSYSNDDADQN